jgi:site-specific DNA-methyltransferase (adenine-specific)
MMMDKARAILARAQQLAVECKTWADLSNALFDPLEGEAIRAFPSAEERGAFRKTQEYQQIRMLLEKKMKETGLVAGATPLKSGKFIVRVPRSLHAALEAEAQQEGTSLNQLVVAKLALRLDTLKGGRIGVILQAFAETRHGFSADRVIVDPELNPQFLQRCRELGLTGTDFELNWELMNARKNGDLSGLPKTKRYTVHERDYFDYASELAVRHLQRTEGVSLDHVLCDPKLAAEFDKCAAQLAPGFSPLDYRWAALGLRKAGRLQQASSVERNLPAFHEVGELASLNPERIPDVAGLYAILNKKDYIFIGQTDNLRRRIERHLAVSGHRGLPSWLWDAGGQPLELSIASTPSLSKKTREAMEILLVREHHPVLNFTRQAA